MTRESLERVAAVLSLCVLTASWFAGSVREKGADIERIRSISVEMEDVKQIAPICSGGIAGERPTKHSTPVWPSIRAMRVRSRSPWSLTLPAGGH